jgi:hypothetical protein
MLQVLQHSTYKIRNQNGDHTQKYLTQDSNEKWTREIIIIIIIHG